MPFNPKDKVRDIRIRNISKKEEELVEASRRAFTAACHGLLIGEMDVQFISQGLARFIGDMVSNFSDPKHHQEAFAEFIESVRFAWENSNA